jgi:hypothetical protein
MVLDNAVPQDEGPDGGSNRVSVCVVGDTGYRYIQRSNGMTAERAKKTELAHPDEVRWKSH